MITISSNLPQVIARLERLEKELPNAIRRAVAPAAWRNSFEVNAEKTLRALVVTETNLNRREMMMALIPRFVATLTAEVIEGGSRFSMSAPESFSTTGKVAEAADIVERLKTRTYGDQTRARRVPLAASPDEQQTLEVVRTAVLKWVQEEKLKDPTDTGLSDDEIADRLLWIMGLHPDSKPTEITEAMKEAGERLASRIQDFMDTEEFASSVNRLDPEMATQWLVAVLETWKALFRTRLHGRIEHELVKMHHSLQGTML